MANLKRDFSAPILDIKGKPLHGNGSVEAMTKALDLAISKVPEAEQEALSAALSIILGEPLTLGAAVAHALTAAAPDEPGLAPGEAEKRLNLALRLVDGGVVEITPEERGLMKRRAGKAYRGALVPGRVAMLLEGDAAPKGAD